VSTKLHVSKAQISMILHHPLQETAQKFP